MSIRYEGACGFLIVLTIAAVILYSVSWLLPGSTAAAFAIFVILLVVLLPFTFGGSGPRYRIIRRGGYAVDVKEFGSKAIHREFDSSKLTRVVVDSYTETEHIISGTPDETYRNACTRDWQFESISKKGGWIILDEKGNDITSSPLSSYQGIARIQSIIPLERYESTEDAPDTQDAQDQYSDMERGVEFYD